MRLQRLACFVIAFCCISALASAQTPRADSLRGVLDTLSENDERYVRTLWEAMDAAAGRSMTEAARYAREAYKLSMLRFPAHQLRAISTYARRLYLLDLLDSAELINDELMSVMRASELDSFYVVKYYRSKGAIAGKRTKIQEAATYYDSALTIATAMQRKGLMAEVQFDLGSLYTKNEANEMAIHYYERALSIYKQLGKREIGVASAYSNLAILYNRLGDYSRADLYTDSCIVIQEGLGRTESLIVDYGNAILNAVYRSKDLHKAAVYLKKLKGIEGRTNTPRYLAFISNVESAYYIETGDFRSGREAALKAYRIAKDNLLGSILVDAYDNLVKSNEGLNDFKNAHHYQKEWIAYRDSINQVEQEKALLELQAKYETEKKETENQRLLLANRQQARLNRILAGGGVLAVLLLMLLFYFYRGKQKANQKLEVQKQQIEDNLREKESLLREIHHRVKNNLQVISSLLNMQSRYFDDPRMIGAIAEGQSRVKAMALIHQKLYQTDQLSEIDFQEYTEQLIGHLATAFGESGKKIKSAVNGSSLKLDIDTAIPLGLILNELITNAYKYAFNGLKGGMLKVDLKLDGESYYNLHITDSGKGLPDGFSESPLNSLGLKLVRMLVDQLDGSLAVSNEPGAHFHIRFKKQPVAA